VRLFTAIDLTDAARDAIAGEQARLKRAIGERRSTLRWVRAEHMHLTLTFLGEVADARVPAVIEATATPVALSPFTIALGGLGVFPPERAPRVLWLGLVEGARPAIDLERELRTRYVALGVEIEPRPYHPHLTLARWRDSRPSDRRLAEGSAAVIARVDVGEAVLYQSRLGPDGPTYTALARASLGG
jgi:2'-5' RNA ligase